MRSSTKIDIWNRALDRIGQTVPLEEEDDDSVAAGVCRRHYDDCLEEALEDRPWSWAKRQAQLAELTSTRAGWEHAYALPKDCVTTRAILVNGQRLSLVPGEMRIPFELQTSDDGQGKVFCTDQDLADADAVEYTARIETVTAFPRQFVEALSWRLAAELALALVKGAAGQRLMAQAIQMYETYLALAFAADLRGNHEDPELDGSGVRARRGIGPLASPLAWRR